MSYSTSVESLDQPLYGASLGQAFSRFWRKYVVFSGRASRSEYWWWFLVALIVGVVLKVIDIAVSGGVQQSQRTNTSIGDILTYLWGLATLLPGLGLTIRRLHDTNRSGFWILIGLVPLVGAIILIVFYVSGPNPAGQRFDR